MTNREKVEREALLTDEKLEEVVEKVRQGTFIDFQGMVCPDIGIATSIETIRAVLNNKLVHIEAEDQVLPKYPVVGHPPNPDADYQRKCGWRECGGRMQRENWMKVERK